jgi:hypothetical protein
MFQKKEEYVSNERGQRGARYCTYRTKGKVDSKLQVQLTGSDCPIGSPRLAKFVAVWSQYSDPTDHNKSESTD